MKLEPSITIRQLPKRNQKSIATKEMYGIADALYVELMKDPLRSAAVVDFSKPDDSPWQSRQEYEAMGYKDQRKIVDGRRKHQIFAIKQFCNFRVKTEKPVWRYVTSSCYLGAGKWAFFWKLKSRRVLRPGPAPKKNTPETP